MKKVLFIILTFSGPITNGQEIVYGDSDRVVIMEPAYYKELGNDTLNYYTGPYCKTSFTYKVKTKIKSDSKFKIIKFHGISDLPVARWNWDFGNGTTSNRQNPEHKFYPGNLDGTTTHKQDSFQVVTLSIVTKEGSRGIFSDTIRFLGLSAKPHKQNNADSKK